MTCGCDEACPHVSLSDEKWAPMLLRPEEQGYWEQTVKSVGDRFKNLGMDNPDQAAVRYALEIAQKQLGRELDPYGASIPTTLDRPTPDGKATRSPRVRTKPVLGRDAAKVLDAILKREQPKIARFLKSTWNAQAEALKYEEIEAAIRSGTLPPGWRKAWIDSYSGFILERMAPVWGRAGKGAAGAVAAGSEAALGVVVPWPEVAERLDSWIGAHGVALAENLAADQAAAMKLVLSRYTTDRPINPRELARAIRPLVGLTQRDAGAVDRYHAKLRADPSVSADVAAKKAGRYGDQLHRRRALNIARTETAFAFNQSALTAVRMAGDASSFSAGVMRKFWRTAEDETVCYFCRGLNGKNVEVDQTFPGATKALPNILVPPAHPSCRCIVTYEMVQ